METKVLAAYNKYVVLANQYRFERPHLVEKVWQVHDYMESHEAIPPALRNQESYLNRQAALLLEYTREAHQEFSKALNPNGWDMGENIVEIPRTISLGDMIIAPRYEANLREALNNGWDEVDVPTIKTAIHLAGRSGTPLIYGFEGLFGNLMPFYIQPPVKVSKVSTD